MPDLLHIIPVGNNAVLDGVFQGQNTSLALGFITNIGIFLSHSNHDALMTRAADDRRKHSTRSIISSKTGLAHTGSIINY
jgi:hypothetical protein